MKELTEYLARALVDNPDEVTVAETQTEQAVILELKVAQSDLGKIIGKHGRTAKAIRSVQNAASTKRKTRVALEIVE